MEDMLLAFEGGGSKTRILLADLEERVRASELGKSSSSLYIERASYLAETTRLLRRVKRTADRAHGRIRVAGLAGPLDLKLVTLAIRSVFGRVRISCISEGDIALALHDLEAGVSLVAGTGSSCRALNEKGEHTSCGGFGPQFGDEGSGYWIGREAIAAVVRARDGRGPKTKLTKRLMAYLRISDLWRIHENPNGSGHLFPPRVAGFTPQVFDAARDGDAVARGICRSAGRELAGLVVAATRQARIRRRPIPLVLTGGVFRGEDLILRPFKQVLRESGLKFQIYPPVTEPAMGIVKLLARQRQRKSAHVS
ncbi:MAG: hypothetical protein HZB26_09505 [Candidatus Hydrogenedentes bacterium]|nr:hypothetical protein [Candidatus Hydrogenedentota bacterium]